MHKQRRGGLRPLSRRQPVLLVALTLLLALVTGCSQPLAGSPPVNAGQFALANVATSLDPNTQGSEAWQQTNGPYAWAYKVDVGSNQGQGRLMMYYVLQDYNQGEIPPLGVESDSAFVAKMKQISASYLQADPSHPIVNSIDLVDPVVDGIPGPDKLYRHFRSDDEVQHYLNLARSNKMLFFFDTQVGHDTQQSVFNTFLPYLEQPDVNLAIDPEWDMRPGVIPGYDRGRTTAQTINWLIDQMSDLVTLRHLPPKILVVHVFRPDEQYDSTTKPDPSQSWDHIQLKPGVTLIISVDGQGSISNKVGNYNFIVDGENGYQFFADTRTTMASMFLIGFKVYIQIPCDGNHPNCEDPYMTPQQVLALKPSPVMVQYQ